ncbi:unnamed protein product [Spodoptera littoralis]|uniref:Uncharacterized protein n=1 Tax=Spodoptera littoralis TaxID=7109 RepID=A0A9P0I9N7_SPOLI|nr:unnamed protein product [Spodoptera littoralis]CAH1642268.1 unnamed protein product [Spodoptera littoralis]
MCCLKIILITTFISCLLLDLVEAGDVVITFGIQMYNVTGMLKPTCDHRIDDMQVYTVREGNEFKIRTNYNKVINEAKCYSKHFDDTFGTTYRNPYRNESTYKVAKEMGGVWECSFLSLKGNPNIYHEILYTNKDAYNFARTICSMKIHVRRKKAPMVILVNNMEMELKRTQQSEEVDFFAVYDYEVGDEVNIICVPDNYNMYNTITMQCPDVDKSLSLPDPDFKSSKRLGFKTTLTSLHDGKYCLFTLKNQSDYTIVRLRFIKLSDEKMNITINGIIIRPELKKINQVLYRINYIHKSNSNIDVVCETTPNYKLWLLNKSFQGAKYNETVIIPDQKINIHFTPEPYTTPNFRCSVDDKQSNYSAQNCEIIFKSNDTLLNDTKIMVMALPANRTVLELFTDNLQIIYYEFDADEVIEIKCSVVEQPVNVVYMHFRHNDTIDKTMISRIVTLHYEHDNPPIECYLKDQVDETAHIKRDDVMYKIKVVFVKKQFIPDPEPEPTTTIANLEPYPGGSTTGTITGTVDEDVPYEIIVAIAAVVFVIIVSIFLILVKVRKRNRTQGSPQGNNYENLPTPSETSIPPYPAQWEANNYAVPIDQRHEEPAYSVPIQPLYTEPVPKNARKPKQNQVGPTYAILNHKGTPKRNVVKDTSDPNYSEVYSRNENYANVAKESPYANAEEPMYCEANMARNHNHYTNLNSSPYANSSAQEYVEPTYCEPQRRK